MREETRREEKRREERRRRKYSKTVQERKGEVKMQLREENGDFSIPICPNEICKYLKVNIGSNYIRYAE